MYSRTSQVSIASSGRSSFAAEADVDAYGRPSFTAFEPIMEEPSARGADSILSFRFFRLVSSILLGAGYRLHM